LNAPGFIAGKIAVMQTAQAKGFLNLVPDGKPLAEADGRFEQTLKQAVRKMLPSPNDEGTEVLRKVDDETLGLADSVVAQISSVSLMNEEAEASLSLVPPHALYQQAQRVQAYELMGDLNGLAALFHELNSSGLPSEQVISRDMTEVLQDFPKHLEHMFTEWGIVDKAGVIVASRPYPAIQELSTMQEDAHTGEFISIANVMDSNECVPPAPPGHAVDENESLFALNRLGINFEHVKEMVSENTLPAEITHLTGRQEHLQGMKAALSSGLESVFQRIQAETVQVTLPTHATASIEAGYEVLLDKVVQSVHMAKDGGITELHVRLKPEFLGRMTIRVIADDHGMRIEIRAESETVRQLMNDNLPTLQHRLAEKGMAFSDLSILADTGWASRREPEQPLERRRAHMMPEQELIEAAIEVAPSIITSTIDYLA
jgi:hypothetical protein